MIEPIRRILRVFDRHGLWESGVELIGSWCFYLYQRHLGVRPYPLKTQDIDFLLPYPYRGRAKINLVEELEGLGFRHDFRPDGSLYLWNAELRIEFMVPERGRGMEKAASVPSLGLRAIPLRFMDILLEHPIPVVEDGIQVSVPDPAAFCLHKLLIASRRRRPESREKDFQQALATAAAVKPEVLRKLYLSFPKSWQKTVIQNLQKAGKEVPLLRDETDRLIDTLLSLKQAHL